MWDILENYYPAIVNGALVTLKLSISAWIVGLTVGFILGAGAYYSKFLRVLLHITSFLALSVPLIVLLYWAHFPLQELLGIVVDPFITAAILLSILNALAVAEIWLGALNRYGQDYVLVARMSGLSGWQSLRFIHLPLAFRNALPMLVATQVAIMQLTLFSSLISVNELFRVAQRINSEVYKPIEIYSALGLVFLLLSGPLYFLAYKLRQKYVQDFNILNRSAR